MKLILFSCKYLLRAKANNLIKIISLTLGLSVGTILLSQVAFDLSYDRCLSDRDRLYQINMWEWDMPQLTAPVLPTLRDELPGITEGTMFVPKNQQAIYYKNQRIEIGLAWVDSSFFDFFGIPILQGDFPKSFPNEKALFLSASTARKIFGNQDPIGQIILFDKSTPYEVAGIFRDFPTNCHLSYIQAALPLTDPAKVVTNTSWLGSTKCRGYVKLAQGIDPQTLSARIPEVVSQHIENGASLNINLKPVSTLHLNNPTVREQIFIKSFLALIVMFIAAMNYVLASISSLSIRSRTMAVYKCYGCSNNKIFGMVLGETAILIMLSILLSALLLFGFRNQIQPILTSPFEAIFTPQNLTEAILLICILFLLTGFIPAKIYSDTPVALAFRHNTLNKRLWKQALLSLQYIGATLLITMLVIIIRQNNFILNQSPGYRYENLLYVNLTDLTPEQANVVKAELSRMPAVEGVCLGNPPLFGWWGDGLYDPATGNEGHAQWTEISSGYIRLLGMEIVDGQEFNEYTAPNQVIVNESLIKMMQWTDSPVGKKIRVGPYSYRIIGVVKNFQNNTFHGSGDPGKYLFYPAVMIYSDSVPTVILQMHFLSPETLTLIQEKLNDLFPDKGFEIHVYKEDFEQQYAREIRLRDMVMYGSIIALLIALIGLIGYTNNEIQRRDQEIAIRKVNGASAGDIFRLIMHDVRWYILGAIVVGLIGAYHFAGKWLQQFMIKIPLSAWMFICCGVIICIITIATIFFKTWRTANENPVKSIKKE